MRFRPLVALLAGAAVPAVREAEARSIEGRGVENTDHNEHCPHDNLLRCLVGSPTLAYTFCSWSVGIYATPVTLYETVTVPATKAVTGTATRTVTQGIETKEPTTSAPSLPSPPSSSAAQSTPSGVPTVTVTQTTTQIVTFDHTQTTTDTVVQTVVQSVVVTTVGGNDSGDTSGGSSGHGNRSLTSSLADSLANATAIRPTPPSRIDRRANAVRTTPKTSLACLDDLQPAFDGVTNACSCFASSQPTPTATSTVTWVEGAPACPAGQASTRNGGSRPLQQPTFPNCFADFHPYNCGTDHVGQIACSCALTAEGTAQCTLGDYERDNACTTSDDCAAGWYCTVIECFGAGVPSVCTKACPVIFAPLPLDSGGGGNDNTDDGTSNDNAVVSARPQQTMAPLAQAHAFDVSSIRNRNISIIIVNNDANGFGSGRARGGTHRPGS